MTLIMSYQKDGFVLMLGDLLLSSDAVREAGIDVPTRFHPLFPTSNLQLAGLSQKLVLFSPTLAAAWAGNRIVAMHILRAVRDAVSPPHREEKILPTIDSLGLTEAEKTSVSFIFMTMQVANDVVEMTVQDYLTGETLLGPNEKVKYAGSGTFHFFDTIGFRMRNAEGHPPIHAFDEMIAAFLGRASVAFYQELVTNNTHDFFYGGGFELLVPDPHGGTLRKLPFATAFWIRDGTQMTLSGPIFSTQYTAFGDLVINRLVRTNGETFKLDRFRIPHPLAPGPDDSMPDPDFDPDHVVHQITEPGGERVKAAIKKGRSKNIAIKLSNGGVSIVESGFYDELMREYKRL